MLPARLALACAASLLVTACPGSPGGGDTHPDAPAALLATSAELGGIATDVTLVGSTAFVKLTHPVPDARPTYAVQAIDLSDPGHPVPGGALAAPGTVMGMGTRNGRLLLVHCDPADLSFGHPRLDEYDPATLQTTATVSLESTLPVGLTVAGDRAFVGGPGAPFGAMAVVDLASSRVVSRYGTHEANLVAVRGDRAYLSGPSLLLDVVDLTTIAAPTRIAAVPPILAGRWPLALAIVDTSAGPRAWVGYDQGIAEVDLSDEAHPALLRVVQLGVTPMALAVDGARALVPGGSAALVLDASAPASAAPSARLAGPVYAMDAAWLGTRAVTVGLLQGRTDASALSVFDVAP